MVREVDRLREVDVLLNFVEGRGKEGRVYAKFE